jgi:hypothetical protein
MIRKPKHAATGRDEMEPVELGQPVFAQPRPTPDPTSFLIRHGSDKGAYKTIDTLNREHRLKPMPFPNPRGFSDSQPEPVLTLDQVLAETTTSQAISAAGQLVFHCVGDTGNVRGPDTEELVADKMSSDFDEQNSADIPALFFHLGDVIYNFGEAEYYYDQFYDPYRDYPAPIIALAGNHDGMVAPGVRTPTLQAFLENFCQSDFVVTPQAGGLSRTAQIQPGIFYTFEAPFVRIICLYSNTLEDPGVISDDEIGDSQLTYLRAALRRVKHEKFTGALIIAHHHPPYTAGSEHGWSIAMQAQIDAACEAVGVWPHAVLSGHAHNYQRFTRVHGTMEIPYIIAGNGGHAVTKLRRRGEPSLRTPRAIQKAEGEADQVTLESYDDTHYGYLRLVVTAAMLRIEYHPADDGAGVKTPDDVVTVDLATRTIR